MTKFTTIPMDVESLHENQLDALILEGTLLEDYGPWGKGQVLTLSFDFLEGTVTEYDDEGEVVQQAKLVITPVASK